MEERRKLKRQHIMFYSRVFHRETGEFLGYLGNLTPMGMMVITEKPIVAGQRMPLRIDLPEDMYRLSLLKLEARSVWCRRDVDPNFYNVGFELHEVSPQAVQVIQQINEDFGLGEE